MHDMEREHVQNLMITNDMGNPLYSDFPSGHLQCLTLLGLQQYIGTGLFGLNLKFIRGGTNRVLIEKLSGFWFALASNGGESRSFLRRQVRFLRDLFEMKFGKQLLTTLSQHPQLSLNAYQESFRDIIHTYCRLCRAQQSFLCHAIEPLVVDTSLGIMIHNVLRESSRACKTNSVNTLLFVGTKLAAVFRPPLAPSLTDAELMHLIVYMESKGIKERMRSAAHDGGLVLENVYLNSDGLPHTVCFARLFHRITLVSVCMYQMATAEEQGAVKRMQESVARQLQVYKDFLLVRENTHLTHAAYVYPFPGLIHFILIDRTSNRMLAPPILSLWAQKVAQKEMGEWGGEEPGTLGAEPEPSDPHQAFVEEVSTPLNNDDTDEDGTTEFEDDASVSEQLAGAERDCPPTPASLRTPGKEVPQTPADLHREWLRAQIWSSYEESQSSLQDGMTFSVHRGADTQTVTSLFFEADGKKLLIPAREAERVMNNDYDVSSSSTSFLALNQRLMSEKNDGATLFAKCVRDPRLYPALSDALYPQAATTIRCYELSCIFVADLSPETVQVHTRRLVHMLKSGFL